MKKRIILLKTTLFLMLTMFSISCSTNPDDIKLNDLKTSCDYVDAMNKVYDQMIKLKGKKTIDQLTQEEKSEMEVWTKKFKEIALAASKKYTEAEVKECADFEKLKTNRDLLSDKKAELTDDDRKKMEERAKLIVDSIAKAALINRP
jgi:hypothetical protein